MNTGVLGISYSWSVTSFVLKQIDKENYAKWEISLGRVSKNSPRDFPVTFH